MSKHTKHQSPAAERSVLVCVTGQRDCDRLIRAGKTFADEKNLPMQVLCVLPVAAAGKALCNELEYLRSTARDHQADMNIYFSDNAAETAAEVARAHHAVIIFTGMAAEPINGFIDCLRRALPRIPIAMVRYLRVYLPHGSPGNDPQPPGFPRLTFIKEKSLSFLLRKRGIFICHRLFYPQMS